MSVDLEAIAQVCHEASRVYCDTLGEFIPHWYDLDSEGREDVISGVRFVIENRDKAPEEMHAVWRDSMIADGWTHGPLHDGEAKTHPNLVDYADLRDTQKRRDAMFRSIVATMMEALARSGPTEA